MTVTNHSRRANGAGSVYFMSSQQRWAVAITAADGKRKVKTFATETEARAWLTRTLSRLPAYPEQPERRRNTANADVAVYWDTSRFSWAYSVTRYFSTQSEALAAMRQQCEP